MDTALAIFNIVVKGFNMFGSLLNYLPQYFLMCRENSVGSFNTFTCYLLLFSNAFRITFSFSRSFDFSFLVQSAVVIALQMLLLAKTASIREEEAATEMSVSASVSVSSRKPNFERRALEDTAILVREFAAFFLCMCCLCLFVRSAVTSEVIGTIGSVFEGVIPLPQLIKNYKRRSVEGLSFVMIFFWWFGDSMKLLFVIINQQPVQFIACSSAVVTLDCIILLQFAIWSKKKASN